MLFYNEYTMWLREFLIEKFQESTMQKKLGTVSMPNGVLKQKLIKSLQKNAKLRPFPSNIKFTKKCILLRCSNIVFT